MEHEHHHEHDHDHDHCHDGCCCGHDHGHGESNGKREVLKYIFGALPVIIGFMSFIPFYIPLTASVTAYVLFGFEVYSGMISGFKKKRIFTEFTLMCVATLGAFAIGEYADAAALMYLYSLGESISDSAYSRSRKNISALLELTPEHVRVQREGKIFEVSPEDIKVGETVIVNAGERVALDGIVISVGAEADTSAVTGESAPLSLYEGVECPSGALVSGGSVLMRVSSEYKNSVAARLGEAVKEAEKRKSVAEKKTARFAAVFTPIAFAVALAIFAVGAAVTGDIYAWSKAGIMVLVVSCPCSLVLSVPLTYFAGVGSAATKGIVFRGGEVMDRASRLCVLAFDKTGTLTAVTPTFERTETYSATTKEKFENIAYAVLAHSPHVCAVAFCKDRCAVDGYEVKDISVLGGRGIVCTLNGKQAIFGNARLMSENGIDTPKADTTVIFGAYDGELLGALCFTAKAQTEAKGALEELKALGIERMAVISGDGEYAVSGVCDELEIGEHYSNVAPDEKAEIFDRLRKQTPKEKSCGYCGDGLNDSAVIALADVGIAMGGCGSALTVESADVVLMDDDISKLGTAIRTARRTERIANQNIALSLGIKIGVLLLGVLLAALEFSIPIELAIVADVGAAVLTVLNATRARK